MDGVEIDLDDVLISIRALVAWHDRCRQVAEAHSSTLTQDDAAKVPDERLRVLPSGELLLYVPAGRLPEVSMTIAVEDWRAKS